ncbi:MAG: molybdopterin-dependent oxidoreductase [Ignavibacteriales bacterium]|nr:molybdopterin-dependent oxidoreductase [Ignavibacteriales bacterium]
MPICFGISFTNTMLNQASALVHVYNDGSIGVSTAAVEMGQGVNEKIKLAVANTFLKKSMRRIRSDQPTNAKNGQEQILMEMQQ